MADHIAVIGRDLEQLDVVAQMMDGSIWRIGRRRDDHVAAAQVLNMDFLWLLRTVMFHLQVVMMGLKLRLVQLVTGRSGQKHSGGRGDR